MAALLALHFLPASLNLPDAVRGKSGKFKMIFSVGSHKEIWLVSDERFLCLCIGTARVPNAIVMDQPA